MTGSIIIWGLYRILKEFASFGNFSSTLQCLLFELPHVIVKTRVSCLFHHIDAISKLSKRNKSSIIGFRLSTKAYSFPDNLIIQQGDQYAEDGEKSSSCSDSKAIIQEIDLMQKQSHTYLTGATALI